MNINGILSFDPNKVRFISSEGKLTSVEKHTIKTEFERISEAHEYLSKFPVRLRDNISFFPAPVIMWDKRRSILVTKFCRGDNLENLLKTTRNEERSSILSLLKDLFHSLRLSGFLWGDYAPRNILYSKEDESIRIVDFEREMRLVGSEEDMNSYSRYVRNYALEEFSCFLFEDEQKFLFSDFIVREKVEKISKSLLGSKRKKRLLLEMFGEKNEYDIGEIEETEFLMASIASPFCINGKIIYPMQIIDKASSKGGVEKYASIVRRIKNSSKREKYNVLSEISNEFDQPILLGK